MRVNILAWAISLMASTWAVPALCGAPPDLPSLLGALRAQPGDPARAARLASALAHHDWMFPGMAPEETRWLTGAVRGTPSMPAARSPDGRREVRFEGALLRLVSSPDGSPMAEATAGGVVISAQWHPSGAVLALAWAGGIEIRDGRTLKAVPARWAGATGPAMAFSPDGIGLATGSASGGASLWDWAAGRLLAAGCPGMGRLESLEFDETGSWLRARTSDGEAALDARPGMAVEGWRGGAAPVVASALVLGGTRWLTVDESGAVDLAPWQGGSQGRRLLLAGVPRAIALDEAGGWAATALAPSKVRLWSLQSGWPVGAWLTHQDISDVVVAKGGAWLWTASPSSIRAHQPVPGQSSVVVSNEPVHAFQCAKSGSWIVALVGQSNALAARVWDGEKPGVEVARVPAVVPGPVDIESSGPWLLLGAPDAGIRQHLARTPDAPVDRPPVGAGQAWEEARYVHEGRRIIARGGNVVHVWNAIDGTSVGEAKVPAGARLADIQVSPDARWLRIEQASGLVSLAWMATGEEVASWRGMAGRGRRPALQGEAFTPDGGRVLVPDEQGGVRLIPLPPSGAAPAWLEDVARLAWGTPRGNASSAVEGLRARLAMADPRDAWTAWGQWWVAGRGNRATSPLGGLSAAALASRVAECPGPVAAMEAWRLASGDRVRRLALAAQMQTNPSWSRPYRAEQGQWLGR